MSAIKNVLSLFSAQASIANGVDVQVPVGGAYFVAINGTFGGTSFKMQVKGPDGTNYIDIPSSTFAVAGVVEVDLPAGAIVRGVLTGGAGMSIYATASLVG